MSNQAKSIVSSRSTTGMSPYILTNGNKGVGVSMIVIYDERGPLIISDNANNRFKFELLKYVSTKPKSVPEWDNKAGFLLVDNGDTSFSSAYHIRSNFLCLHIDNTRPYVRELIDYWELHSFEPGTICQSFSLEGCRFYRAVRNPEIVYARQGIQDVLKPYDDVCTVFNNYVSALHNITELIDACDHIKKEAVSYQRTARRISESMGIVELIYANGANGPINHNDVNDISRYKAFQYSYRIENA